MVKQNKHEYYMSLAIKEAMVGVKARHGGPFGSVIVKDGKVIAKGHNHVVANNDPTAHGEIMAIRQAAKKLKTFDLKGCVLYTTGYPCPMCMAACQWANIRTIYYGCNLQDTRNIGFRDEQFYKRRPHPKECARAQCLKVYKLYDSQKNNIKY